MVISIPIWTVCRRLYFVQRVSIFFLKKEATNKVLWSPLVQARFQ